MNHPERAALRRAALETRTRWRLLGLSIALGTGAVLAAVGLLTTSGYLVSRAAQRPDILALGVAIVGVRFFGISRALLRYGERLASHDLAFRTLTDLRRRFFERLVPLVPGGIPGIARSDLLSRFVGDVDRLQDLYLRGISPPVVALLAGGASVLLATLILPAAGAVLAAMLILAGLLAPALTGRAARSAGRRQASARADLSADIVEISRSSAEIAVAGRAADWLRRSGDSGSRLAEIQRRDAVTAGLAGGLGTGLAALAAVLVAVVAIPAVDQGRVAGVLLAALVLLTIAAFEAVAPLGAAAASREACADAAMRLEAVTVRTAPVPEPKEPERIPADGPLEMSAVGFRYERGSRWILDGADLRLHGGQSVALVGPSGAGKSTVAELLVRFRDPVAGSVRLGGLDLRRAQGEAVRSAVRLSPQDCYLFTTTLRGNVAIGCPGATDEEIAEALGMTGLGDWLDTLPDGLDTEVGESGARVSGGQRQRIAASRLLVSRSRFLIFDEPTANLDPAGGAALRRALAAVAEAGPGVLVITHELDDPDVFDEVLTLRDGRLISV